MKFINNRVEKYLFSKNIDGIHRVKDSEDRYLIEMDFEGCMHAIRQERAGYTLINSTRDDKIQNHVNSSCQDDDKKNSSEYQTLQTLLKLLCDYLPNQPQNEHAISATLDCIKKLEGCILSPISALLNGLIYGDTELVGKFTASHSFACNFHHITH
jgi:hypothetical protein